MSNEKTVCMYNVKEVLSEINKLSISAIDLDIESLNYDKDDKELDAIYDFSDKFNAVSKKLDEVLMNSEISIPYSLWKEIDDLKTGADAFWRVVLR